MPEAVIVAAARTPIGRAGKGSLVDVRPDDLAAGVDPGRRSTGCRVSTRRPWTTSMSAAPSRATSTAATWPAGSRCSSGSTACRPRRSTGSAPPACRPRGWPSTRSGPARATRSCRPASSASRATAASARPGSIPVETHHPRLRRRRGSGQPGRRRPTRSGTTRARTASCPTSTSPWARRPRTSPPCGASAGREQDAFGVRSQNLARDGRSPTASSTPRSRR